MTVQDSAEGAYQWQQERRKPDGRFDWPVGGFGHSSFRITLWLPTPDRTEQKLVFENGDLVLKTITGCLADAEVVALRDAVIRDFASEGVGRLSVGRSFLRYAAAVIRVNYRVTDDDLNFLLLSPAGRWHAEMVQHVVGGADYIEAVNRNAPALLEMLSRQTNSSGEPPGNEQESSVARRRKASPSLDAFANNSPQSSGASPWRRLLQCLPLINRKET